VESICAKGGGLLRDSGTGSEGFTTLPGKLTP
jgi:hypothetical protein